MSTSELVIRVAAKGDGITESGRHVPFAAPEDRVAPDGTIAPGPHHQMPPCRHFGKCGGCQLQHLDDETLAGFVRDRVANAAEGQGLQPALVTQAAMSPPHSRRRASLKAINGGGGPLIGFSESGSHRLVDLRACHVLLPELFAAVESLRALLAKQKGRYAVSIELARVEQGLDCALKGYAPEGLEAIEALLDYCRDHRLARLTLDNGYGPEPFWEPEPVTVKLGGLSVAYPPGAFMQATDHGETALVDAAREWLADCGSVADLFAGLGTFALPLAGGRKVLAAEAERAAVLALKGAATRAGGLVETAHRDLFRNPLRADEMRGLDGVVIDPPRAGARAQVEQLAASGVERIVYISCNPSSWSRDGKLLVEAGYKLVEVRPVGQFRWSTHVELASLFVRQS